jgi:hypothetical protein
MPGFFGIFRRQPIILILAASALLAVAPVAHASSSDPVDKHARKMEKRLARYRAGSFLQLDLRDSSEVMGHIAQLSDASFRFTDADNNKIQTYSYADVAHVKEATEYIGAGSEFGRHFRLWVPVVVGAAIAGGAVAAYQATH